MTVYLGRYEVVREVGRGGMATVFLGQDRVLRRPVAIKVLHPHLLTQADARARFAREARVIARLKHPGIVEVHDFSEADADQVVLVVEYVDGEPLSAFLSRHDPLLPEVAALAVASVADALAHAHQRGVIHRDVKPENLMVRRDGVLKLMDFGIAHVVDMEHLTVTGAIVGSPAHMSPEQVDGRGLDARTDVFSLGTLFYLMATGHYPFEADSPTALFRAIAEGRFPDPRQRRPGFPEDLCRILLRMMARDPDQRHADAGQVRDALLEQTRALGLGPPAEELPRYLADPVAGEREFRQRVAEARAARAQAALRVGRPALAIQEAGAALACVPDHEGARQAMDRARRVAGRRAWARRVGLGVLAVAAMGLIAAAAWWLASRSPAGLGAGDSRDVVDPGDPGGLRGPGDVRALEDPAAGMDPGGGPGDARDVLVGGEPGVEEVEREPHETALGRNGHRVSGEGSRGDGGPRGGAAGRSPSPVMVPLSIQAFPPAVRIFVDGNLLGEGRVEGLPLSPGRHRVRLSHPACTVCLDVEEDVVLDPRRPPPGPLRLSIRYRDAQVLIRGDPGGRVFLAGERTERGRVGAPVSIPMRQVGPVPIRLRVEWDDRPAREVQVRLEAGGTATVDLP
ncbi:MAG TPA: serine/threonine-protein kinase [Myxococcota bacterium]|nr:serine/threonine-protein kinase [Myxococcota bacterium]HQK52180.1 serine/threonine-protein kinase [Myxococcota bacterium]